MRGVAQTPTIPGTTRPWGVWILAKPLGSQLAAVTRKLPSAQQAPCRLCCWMTRPHLRSLERRKGPGSFRAGRLGQPGQLRTQTWTQRQPILTVRPAMSACMRCFTTLTGKIAS